ncbi:hypothetical protein [Pelovirga terrestris]|uniref:Uncharacterized protein n=1 Tax=Pelovirga terrestris TaxID=2771352 RepID=A0A8J6UHE8_9BACT|nr:hypothetical protein [Pelovirga terrestris]MBD1399210.1 hypothetical protein [Pelovirga terrestris]
MTAGLAARAITTQQGHAAPPVTPKNRQATVASATDRYRSTSQPIIDAEYVDLYNPIRRPPAQQNQWRNMILEEDTPVHSYTAKYGISERNQQLIERYGQNLNDLPSPGSFVNLLA